MSRIRSRVTTLFGVAALMSPLSACNTASAAVPIPDPAVDAPLAAHSGEQVAVLAGGCFWGIQAVFEHVKGVIAATSGFSGGHVVNPTYADVTTETTGHAESVRIVYDPSKITYGQLLKVFFSVAHDPTEMNRQGPDVGTSYRSAIFFTSEEQARIARAYIQQLDAAHVYPTRIVTEVDAFQAFYPAASVHQDYAFTHPDSPYIVINDAPKVVNLKRELPGLYSEKRATALPPAGA